MAVIGYAMLMLLTLFPDASHQERPSIRVLKSVARYFPKGNAALGAFSRSKTIASLSRTLRGDSPEDVRKSLAQAVLTLGLLDLGGGMLLPFANHIIDVIKKNTVFGRTANYWKAYNSVLKAGLEGNLDNLNEEGKAALKRALDVKKNDIIKAFGDDVADLQRVKPNSKTLKFLRRAKFFVKVKELGKVLGPFFDIVGIGVNAWSLDSAIKDCTRESCNYGTVAAATLSVASSAVGLLTAVGAIVIGSSTLGPVGIVFSCVLALGATIIELASNYMEMQAAIRQAKKHAMMRELDRYSRLQLYNASKFFADNDIERSDMYVVNQGHMPDWIRFFQDDELVKIRTHFGVLGNATEGTKTRRRYTMINKCNTPAIGDAHVPARPSTPGAPPITVHECPYLVDGFHLFEGKVEYSTDEEELRDRSLGYGLYGLTQGARSHVAGQPSPPANEVPYDGSIILINTDQVQPNRLAVDPDLNAKLRGLNLRTDLKGGDDDVTPYDDMIAIGNMPNLKEGETVYIKMGRGNDALNIDGMIGEFRSAFEDILRADLGHGHNSLGFSAIADGSPIKGINFDAQARTLSFKHGDTGSRTHRVGRIVNVEILEASPFDDTITLYAYRRGDAGTDFTVFKFRGKATYIIDLEPIRGMSETRHFKIIDSTSNEEEGQENRKRNTDDDDDGDDENDDDNDDEIIDRCIDHEPVLRLLNFETTAVVNDVHYVAQKIMIYGSRTVTSEKKSFKKWILKKAASQRAKTSKKTTRCQGEPADGSHPQGGAINGKVLLATVTMSTTCPARVYSFTTDGDCMMTPRPVSELDLTSFEGKAIIADFTSNIFGSNGANDFVTLECPAYQVSYRTRIDLRGGNQDTVVIRGDKFLEPCEFDGENATIVLERDGRSWKLTFDLDEENHFTGQAKIHILKGVEKIINEYGQLVVDLTATTDDTIQLLDAYARVTMRDIGNVQERERSSEFKANLLMCLQHTETPTAQQRELCSDYA